MKNLTLRIDEKVLAEARKLAALKGTTVAKLVREFLAALVEAGEGDLTVEEVRLALAEFATRSQSAPREGKWGRDEIYGEQIGRLPEERLKVQGFAEAPPPEDAKMTKTLAERLPTLEEMTRDTGAPPEPGHDEWFRRQVQRALDDKKSGKAEYEDFDKVAAEFGFYAR